MNHSKQLSLISCKAVKKVKTFPRNFHELIRGPQFRRFWTKSCGRSYWSICNSNPHGRVRVGFLPLQKKNAPIPFFPPLFSFCPNLTEIFRNDNITQKYVCYKNISTLIYLLIYYLVSFNRLYHYQKFKAQQI